LEEWTYSLILLPESAGQVNGERAVNDQGRDDTMPQLLHVFSKVTILEHLIYAHLELLE